MKSPMKKLNLPCGKDLSFISFRTCICITTFSNANKIGHIQRELHGICEKVVFLRPKKYIYQFIFCVCNGFLWHITIPLYGASSLNIQLTIPLLVICCNMYTKTPSSHKLRSIPRVVEVIYHCFVTTLQGIYCPGIYAWITKLGSSK